MTRKSLAKTIMHEEMLISPDDQKRFHEFAVSLDHSVGASYHAVLSELKVRHAVIVSSSPVHFARGRGALLVSLPSFAFFKTFR